MGMISVWKYDPKTPDAAPVGVGINPDYIVGVEDQSEKLEGYPKAVRLIMATNSPWKDMVAVENDANEIRTKMNLAYQERNRA